MKALSLPSLDDTLAWAVPDDGKLPRRLSAYTTTDAARAPESVPREDSLLGKVRLKDPRVGRLLADGLHGVRCRAES